MYVEALKTEVNCFDQWRYDVFDVTLTDHFQYQDQFVCTGNITWRGQRTLVQIPNKIVYIILMILLLSRQIETFNIKCHIWNMKNEKFETPQCFIWILMKNMSISYNRSICVNSSTKLLGNGIITGLVIATDIIFGLFQNCFIMHIQSTCI